MSWSTENGTHEGWLDGRTADGRSVASWGPNGIVTLDDGTALKESTGVVTEWRLTCSCGWTSTTTYLDDSLSSEEVAHTEWSIHIAPDEMLENVRKAAAVLTRARKVFDDAAREAAKAGVSWSTILETIAE